jgi:hypothetical protein
VDLLIYLYLVSVPGSREIKVKEISFVIHKSLSATPDLR